jgi:hypothetical protein
MGIVKKYQFYKRLLLTLFAVNVLFIMFGIIAVFKFFQTHDVTAAEVVIVGLGTFVFGILTPYVIIDKFMTNMAEMRKRTEIAVAAWVSGWMENYKDHDNDAIHDPLFWLNIGLLTAEVVGQHTQHPVGRMLAEFAPLLKQELAKSNPKKQKIKKSAA